jgi:hypothetical protein
MMVMTTKNCLGAASQRAQVAKHGERQFFEFWKELRRTNSARVSSIAIDDIFKEMDPD